MPPAEANFYELPRLSIDDISRISAVTIIAFTYHARCKYDYNTPPGLSRQ